MRNHDGIFHADSTYFSRPQAGTNRYTEGDVPHFNQTGFTMQQDDERTTTDRKKTSFVEFLGSIKFGHRSNRKYRGEVDTHFAAFEPRARPARAHKAEDNLLVRSAN